MVSNLIYFQERSSIKVQFDVLVKSQFDTVPWFCLHSIVNHDQFKTPGQLIKAKIDERGWTQRVLAIVLGVDETGLNKVISGKRPLDAKTALALSPLIDVTAEVLLDLQKRYDLAQARIVEIPDPGRENRAHLFGSLPVSEMISRGWINASDIRDTARVESELAEFFEAADAASIEILPHAAKKTEVAHDATPIQLAWLYRVRKIAREILVPRYSKAKLEQAVEEMKNLRVSPDSARQVPKLLASAGVRFLLVEALSGSKIDGVCFWLNDESPVIALTLRFDRIDNFWFVLRHEIEHVLRGHGKSEAIIDRDLNGKQEEGNIISLEEETANLAAADFCVPQVSMKKFISKKAPLVAERDLIGFARTVGVHPGLVAGQLQHATGRFERFREHLVPIRSKISPSAISDGWGEIYPLEHP